jgi:hypothetical protein
LKKFRVKSIFFAPVVTGMDFGPFPNQKRSRPRRKDGRFDDRVAKERAMTRTNTRSKNSSAKSAEEKLRAELADLARAIEQMPLSKQICSREFELLTQKCNQLRLGFEVRPAQFRGINVSDKIDSCDSTLRHE